MLAVRSLGTGRFRSGLTRYAWAAANNPAFRNTAARVIQRMYRGLQGRRTFKRRAMSARNGGYKRQRTQGGRARIGMPIQRGPARRRNTLFIIPAGSSWESRTLNKYDISNIPQGTEITQRTRNMINLKGFRICGSWLNTSDTNNQFVNYALINPKNNVNINNDEFFRSYGTERSLSFDSPELTAMDYHCRPINTDDFNIISHKRFKLSAKSSDTQNNTSHEHRVMRYIKCKRQLRYTAYGEQEYASTPIWFVWWFDSEGKPPESVPEPGVLLDLRVITYFSNPST